MLKIVFRHICLVVVVGLFSFCVTLAAWEPSLDFLERLPDTAPEQIRFSHTEGKGLGYTEGYTSLNIFLSQPLCRQQLVPFVDLRGHLFNDGRYASNMGLGLRWLNDWCGCDRVWGVNFFYDTLKASHRPYHQVSLGLEALGETWDLRFNGYMPVGRHRTGLYAFVYEDLAPTAFLFRGTEKFSMKGVDAEIGYHLCHKQNINLYLGAGPYYYWEHSANIKNVVRPTLKHVCGGRIRADVSIMKVVSVEAVSTYDSRFKWTGQITVGITLPFDMTLDCGGCPQTSCCLSEGLYQPVLRNEIIVIDKIHRESTNPEILDPEFEP